MNDEFVVVWAVPKEGFDVDCWVMVRHRRGWECPGGSIGRGEDPDIAALRELFEETGLLGTAKAMDFELIKGGCVVLVEVDRPPSPDSWSSDDESIEEVGWCVKIPEGTAWGDSEIERIRDHDWSASISLES
jgi:8-oxo-dGTP pyrophosphatase MutT (NUDIX family)